MSGSYESDDFRTVLTTEQILALTASGQALAALEAWTHPFINLDIDHDFADEEYMTGVAEYSLPDDTPPTAVYASCSFREGDASEEEWSLGRSGGSRYNAIDPAYKALPVIHRGMMRIFDVDSPDAPAGIPPFDEYAFWQVAREIPHTDNPALIIRHRTRAPRDFYPVSAVKEQVLTEQMVRRNLHDLSDPNANPLFDELAGESIIETWTYDQVAPCTVLDAAAAQELAGFIFKAQVEGQPILPD